MMSLKQTIATSGLIALLIAPACVSQKRIPLDEDIADAADIRVVYQLTDGRFAELLDAWNTLLHFEPDLSRSGYTLVPECFHHSRYDLPSGELITFVARNPSPTGCSPYGSFRLSRPLVGDQWQCSIKISNSSTLPCDLSK